jgi:hypothetical protein
MSSFLGASLHACVDFGKEAEHGGGEIFPPLVFEPCAFRNLFNELDSCVSQISHVVFVQLLISASVLLLLLFDELDSFVTQSFTLVL